jgi:hypothetical protein
MGGLDIKTSPAFLVGKEISFYSLNRSFNFIQKNPRKTEGN